MAEIDCNKEQQTTNHRYAFDVKRELQELKKLGVRVPRSAIKMCDDETTMREYFNSGASVSEIADLLIQLNAAES